MRSSVFGIVGLALLVATLGQAQDKKPDRNEFFLDGEKAGPHFAIQGEYEGEIAGKGKLGAQVVAHGDGNFPVVFLPGGLPGAGWDGKVRIKVQAKTADGKTAFQGATGSAGAGWNGEIASGSLTGKTKEGDAFTLKRVVRQSSTLGTKPPPGAIVLFDGSSVDEWTKAKLDNGLLAPDKGNALSKKTFRDFKAHVEFRTPFMPRFQGQGRANSGIYLQNRYELQIHDSFGMDGKFDECGAFYNQKAPLLNMCFPPLSWQTYEIQFQAARFDAAGKKTANAVVTVLQNGVKIHDNLELTGVTTGSGDKTETDKPGLFHLQDYGQGGGPVHFRNIWVVDSK